MIHDPWDGSDVMGFLEVDPMDIAIIKGKDTPANGWELRMTLRSLSRLQDLGRVFIIGYIPTWINQENVTFIPFPDPYGAKDANLLNKLVRLSTEDSLNDDFIVFSDDQPLLSDVYSDDFQAYGMEDLKDRRKFNTGWMKRLRDTMDVLREAGMPTYNFEGHIPYMVNKDKIRDLLNWPILSGRMTIFTTYFNCHGIPPVEGIDTYRANLHKPTPVGEVGMAVYKHFGSLRTDSMANWAVIRLLEGMYPDKSPYETDIERWSLWTPQMQSAMVTACKGADNLINL